MCISKRRIGVSWIGTGLFLARAIAGGKEARGQGFLIDLLFWVTLSIVAGASIGNWLGIMGYIDTGWFWFGNQGLSYTNKRPEAVDLLERRHSPPAQSRLAVPLDTSAVFRPAQ
jgi:nitric oxide reductase large subunit